MATSIDYPYKDGVNLALGPGTTYYPEIDQIHYNGKQYIAFHIYEKDLERVKAETKGASRDEELRVMAIGHANGDVTKARNILKFLQDG